MGEALHAPIFGMTVPIRDAQGKVLGALTGVVNLGKPNFLDKITQGHYGKTGAFLLNAPQHRVIVTASDKSRIMQPLPAPGVNKMLDRYMQGFEGYGYAVDSRGVEMLNAAKGIPVAGWFIAVVIPTDEAFAPIHNTLQHIAISTTVFTLLACGLIWLLMWQMLSRQLSPMIAATRTLSTLSESNHPLQPLPITSRDEIGELIAGFNRLLETLAAREKALQERETRYRSIVETSMDGFWVLDGNGRILEVNDRYLHRSGYSREELLGMSLFDIDAATTRQEIRTVLARAGNWMGEVWHRARDGSVWPLEVSSVCLPTESGRRYAFLRDITERKRTEEELKRSAERLTAVMSQLTVAEERERRAIATDLHDDLSQLLALANLKLRSLPSPSDSDCCREAFCEAVELVNQAERSSRSLSFQISPPQLFHLGLVPALETLAQELQKVHKLIVMIHDDGKPKDLTQTARSVLYRATRELLLNVAKHANVEVAHVDVRSDDGLLLIAVTDSGVGFDKRLVEAPAPGAGFGLVSMRERLRLIGGEFDIDTRPGDGAVATLTVPLSVN
jgi:PAS domain S-box-containing protein